MKDRRDFIKVFGTAFAGMVLLPEFLKAIPLNDAELASGTENTEQILVCIQLSGGNDGLNTFIPYMDDAYYEMRGSLAIPRNQVLAAGNSMGWHPSMQGFSDIMQDGGMSVIQNIGYPNPDRSHFRSMEIWQTASDTDKYLNTGWLGRYLDATCEGSQLKGVNIDIIDSLAMQGSELHSIALQNPESFEKQMRGMHAVTDTTTSNANLAYVRKLAVSAFEGADQIGKAMEKTAAFKISGYPDNALAKNLYWVSRMIQGNLNSKVYYTSFGGFDTHANQLGVQKNKLEQVSLAVKAFYSDIKAAGLMDRVTVMVFSEFGRRVVPNGSGGTDHGKAAPLFIIGGKNKGSVIGQNPNFNNLSQGDLPFEYDFRRVYSTILNQKLATDPALVGLSDHKTISGLF